MLLNFADDGPGPVVVLLHGFPLDLSMWDAQRETLGSMYRVITPDLRGHGRSAAPDGIYPIDDMADDVVETLDSLRIAEPVVLGGLSMGGYVALSIAARYPKRLRGLILMNTHASSDSPDAARLRKGQASEVEETGSVQPVVAAMMPRLFSPLTQTRRPELVAKIREVMENTSPRAVAGALRGLAARPDRTPDLARISLPTLVMSGSDDVLIPPDVTRAMAAAMPNAEMVIIPESGHLSPLENPASANGAILRFLSSLA